MPVSSLEALIQNMQHIAAAATASKPSPTVNRPPKAPLFAPTPSPAAAPGSTQNKASIGSQSVAPAPHAASHLNTQTRPQTAAQTADGVGTGLDQASRAGPAPHQDLPAGTQLAFVQQPASAGRTSVSGTAASTPEDAVGPNERRGQGAASAVGQSVAGTSDSALPGPTAGNSGGCLRVVRMCSLVSHV